MGKVSPKVEAASRRLPKPRRPDAAATYSLPFLVRQWRLALKKLPGFLKVLENRSGSFSILRNRYDPSPGGRRLYF